MQHGLVPVLAGVRPHLAPACRNVVRFAVGCSELRASVSGFEDIEQAHVVVLHLFALSLGVHLHSAEQALQFLLCFTRLR